MKYGKVLTYKDLEEAEKLIGKRVVGSDHLWIIEEFPESRDSATLTGIDFSIVNFPFNISGWGNYQFIREVIEEEPQLMTNRQLAEWCAKGNGEYIFTVNIYTHYSYSRDEQDSQVSDKVRIRSWDSDEWVLPTVDIYERDCKKVSD